MRAPASDALHAGTIFSSGSLNFNHTQTDKARGGESEVTWRRLELLVASIVKLSVPVL